MPHAEIHTNVFTGEEFVVVRIEPLALPRGARPTAADLDELARVVIGWGNQWATQVAHDEVVIDVTCIEVVEDVVIRGELPKGA